MISQAKISSIYIFVVLKAIASVIFGLYLMVTWLASRSIRDLDVIGALTEEFSPIVDRVKQDLIKDKKRKRKRNVPRPLPDIMTEAIRAIEHIVNEK